jgi:hypothetical protein
VLTDSRRLPYVLVPRTLNKQEWIERYSPPPKRVQVINDCTGHMASASTQTRIPPDDLPVPSGAFA